MNIKGRKTRSMKVEGRMNTLLSLVIKCDSRISWKSRLEEGKQVLPCSLSISQSVFLRGDVFLMNSGKMFALGGPVKWTKSSIVLHTFPYYSCALDSQLVPAFKGFISGCFVWLIEDFVPVRILILSQKQISLLKLENPLKTNALRHGKPFTQFCNFITCIKWMHCSWISTFIWHWMWCFSQWNPVWRNTQLHFYWAMSGISLESWLVKASQRPDCQVSLNPHVTEVLPPKVSCLPKRQSLRLYSKRFIE